MSKLVLIRLLTLLAILLPPAHWAAAEQANVFIYHRFNDARYPSTSISQQNFRAHLQLLTELRYEVLSLGEVVDRLQSDEALPQRCATITVDDGYRSFLSDGWPLLKQFGYPATLFVSTDTVGGDGYLDWQELKRLQDEGVEIGNHSASHAFYTDRFLEESEAAWKQRIAADLSRAQQAFEQHLGRSPRLFAYPYGEFSPQLVDLVREAGFAAAFGQQSGVIASSQDLFRLPRFPMGGDFASLSEFRQKLSMKSLPVKIIAPATTIVTAADNPPALVFTLDLSMVDPDSLRCFAPGPSECRVSPVSGKVGLYQAKALNPFTGRRSKYTLTAMDRQRRLWYWFSQLWVQPQTDNLPQIDKSL